MFHVGFFRLFNCRRDWGCSDDGVGDGCAIGRFGDLLGLLRNGHADLITRTGRFK